MTRLIDADNLKNAFRAANLEKALLHRQTLFLSDILGIINDAPTIEQERKTGKWIKADSQQYFRKHYPAFTCSECGQRKDSQKMWHYCPNCGARMVNDNDD